MADTALYIAIYGAGLSTVLALVKLIPEWPIITLVPAAIPDVDVSLQIINPAKRPLFIDGSTQFPRHKPRFRIFEQRSLDTREEIARAFEERMGHRPPGPRVFVPAEGTALLTVRGIEYEEERLIVFWWHRNWLFRHLRLPAIVRVSSNLVSIINRT